MHRLKDESIQFIKSLEKKFDVTIEVQMLPIHSPLPMSTEVAIVLETVANNAGIMCRRINIGAGHDVQNMASAAKTCLLFVPSINGISFSRLE